MVKNQCQKARIVQIERSLSWAAGSSFRPRPAGVADEKIRHDESGEQQGKDREREIQQTVVRYEISALPLKRYDRNEPAGDR